MRRLSKAGFRKEIVTRALLPDWWDESCARDPSLLPDLELRVARFLGLGLAAVSDPATPLVAPAYPGAQLRRVRDLDRDRLAPAIHMALQVAAAVARNMPESGPSALPADGLDWRNELVGPGARVTLDDVLNNLWGRGIPVIPIDVLPAPSFQGLACIVEDRPVIVIGHKNDEPGRLAFLVSHEAGHVAAGDCAPGTPVVDEEEEILDDADIERNADRYATRVLVGSDATPHIDGADFKDLARCAADIEHDTGADASAVIFAWAARTGEYAKASMAVKALYRGAGGRRQLLEHFERRVDIEGASETDRSLLRCTGSGVDRDASAA